MKVDTMKYLDIKQLSFILAPFLLIMGMWIIEDNVSDLLYKVFPKYERMYNESITENETDYFEAKNKIKTYKHEMNEEVIANRIKIISQIIGDERLAKASEKVKKKKSINYIPTIQAIFLESKIVIIDGVSYKAKTKTEYGTIRTIKEDKVLFSKQGETKWVSIF